ncbi:MAG TPA: bifunctional 3-(3-hydroxy-phenyl)propionate/3-hydroxycinnamic acid hydroxylase, partial [Thermodesulfobacteriota bacterium]|nr:bifunctional 3-(3-hydroxy-phenyl)propionate/3-hydroxycinnamic acid hydroxylase [Thermodesulfobacteriota bacterium]
MTGRAGHWPVAVVGAGPTGLTLAGLLARHGVPVLLVERNATTVQEPRAVTIDDEALRTMQAVGLIDRLLPTLGLGYGYRYVSAAGRCFLRVQPAAREYGYPRRNAFHQPVLERLLREHLAARPEVALRFGTELTGFEQGADGVTLALRRADGTGETATCDFLVGCDGARSTVRQALGIRMIGTTFRERWLIVDLWETRNRTPDTQVFCNPARPCITLPGPGGTRRYEFMLHDGEAEAEMLAPERVRALLRLYGPDEACPVRRTAVYTFHARMAERWRAGRVFLAGDAAHLSPPFAGQGMNSGIRDAHNLAWKLAAVLAGHLGPGLLDTYEAERRDHAWAMIRLALRMGRVMTPRSRPAALAMEAGFRLLGLCPPARDYFAQMRFKPKPRLRAGFVAAPGCGRARSLVGALFPQAAVADADGERLLDDVLGPGFVLLAPPGTPPALFERLPADPWPPLPVRRVAVVAPGDGAAAPSGVRV